MTAGYDLGKLDPSTFEHLCNALAIAVLGSGHTGFGPGPDGGRDGYFEGEAPYPSQSERWKGRWYLQAKFHAPHLSKDPQKWLIEQITAELEQFSRPGSRREWPDNWIIATNIDPSGSPETGAFDAAKALVRSARPRLESRFHIWGGNKIISLLSQHEAVSRYYLHFLTPGNVLARLYEALGDAQAEVKDIIRYLCVAQLTEQQYTKLEQAGSPSDNRPGIHKLFVDIPFGLGAGRRVGMALASLSNTAAQNHQIDDTHPDSDAWDKWSKRPERARIWFIKGGPGQGKSTVGQYLCQIQRAAHILGANSPPVSPAQKSIAKEVKAAASAIGVWPSFPRVPVTLELRDFAQWYGQKPEGSARGVLTYLSERISVHVEQPVQVGTLRRAFSLGRWLFVFDGLDEVPGDVKSQVAGEVTSFVDGVLIAASSDALVVCTSRPQGYAGQFSALDACVVELSKLTPVQALACARPVLEIDRSIEERQRYSEILREAIGSTAIQQIMTTPLQAHIMAVVVRDGGRPPERKWQLFTNFYQVIKRREANRRLPDTKLAALLREGDKLLKALHNRLGFELQFRAETSSGAQTSLDRAEFAGVVQDTVSELQDAEIAPTVSTLMEAATDRLVLVSTPESGDRVRFDIRPLQEFFASEYVYEAIDAARLIQRLRIIGADAHWREIMHFLLSALIENNRQTELTVSIRTLVDLDGHEDLNLRVLNRRLAVGSGIVARLLSEGVLEQDKRLRQQIRACLEPLFGSTDVEQLAPLLATKHPHSLGWLTDVAIDHLLEASEGESIGAAFLLAKAMSDFHPRAHTVRERLATQSMKYRACLFTMVGSTLVGRSDEDVAEGVADWVLELVLSSLESPDWAKLGDGVSSAMNLLRTKPAKVAALLVGEGSNDEPALALEWLITGWDDRGPDDEDGDSEKVGGLLTLQRSPPPDALNIATWAKSTWTRFQSLKGIFSFLGQILRVSQVKSRPALELLAAALAENSDAFRLLPYDWKTFLPDSLINSNNFLPLPKKISWAGDDGCSISMYFQSPASITSEDWDALMRRAPFALFHLLAERKTIDTTYLETAKGQIGLLKTIRENLQNVIAYPEIWGRLVSLFADAAEVRLELLRAAASPPPRRFYFSGEVHPFVVDLTKESALLPHICSMLVGLTAGPRHRLFAHELSPNEKSLNDWIKEFCPDPNSLLLLALSSDGVPSVRGIAACMYILHPQAHMNQRGACERVIVESYRESDGRWFLPACGAALQANAHEGVESSRIAMGELLSAAREDFAGRLGLDAVLNIWRQTSAAPVHRVGGNEF